MYLIRLWETAADRPIVLEEVTENEKNDIIECIYDQDVIYFQDTLGDRYINTRNISQIFIENIDEVRIDQEEIKEQQHQYKNGTGVERRRAERFLSSRGLL